MQIQAYERCRLLSLLKITERRLADAEKVELLGYYEEMDEVFYLFHGSYEIECAFRLGKPLLLRCCAMHDRLHCSEIDFDDWLEDYQGRRVFDSRGEASVQDIIAAIPRFSGEIYEESDFCSVTRLPYR